MFHWEVSPSAALREMCGDRNPAPLMKIQAQWHLQCSLLSTSTKRNAPQNVNENVWVTGQHLPHSSWQQRTPLNCRRGWLMASKAFPERKTISHCRNSELKYDIQTNILNCFKNTSTEDCMYSTVYHFSQVTVQMQPSYCGEVGTYSKTLVKNPSPWDGGRVNMGAGKKIP